MKNSSLIALTALALGGCASSQDGSDTYSPYHKLLIDSPEAQVWIDSRFTLMTENDNQDGKMWIYTDEQGQPNQQYVMVYAGDGDNEAWPPGPESRAVKLGSPIGTIYETYGGIQSSELSLDQIGESFGVPVPACGFARFWNHRGEQGRHLFLAYMEGAHCAAVFGSDAAMAELNEMGVKEQARAAIKLKAR